MPVPCQQVGRGLKLVETGAEDFARNPLGGADRPLDLIVLVVHQSGVGLEGIEGTGRDGPGELEAERTPDGASLDPTGVTAGDGHPVEFPRDAVVERVLTE
jgi:hypothetical protein